ncbi:MAG: hypothetical protein ACREAC_06320, partial [Blastocatellia bacterium]
VSPLKTRFLFLALLLVVLLPAFTVSRTGNSPVTSDYIALADDGGSHGSPSNCPCSAQAAPSPQVRIQPDRNKQPVPTSNLRSSHPVGESEAMAIVKGFLLWIGSL